MVFPACCTVGWAAMVLIVWEAVLTAWLARFLAWSRKAIGEGGATRVVSSR
jgi:hypothetical protein